MTSEAEKYDKILWVFSKLLKELLLSRRKLIQEGLRKKKECEDRAVAIVEKLLSNEQSREWIRDAVWCFT